VLHQLTRPSIAPPFVDFVSCVQVLIASAAAAPVVEVLGANPDHITVDPTVDVSSILSLIRKFEVAEI
jgi:hypothetical protein